MAIALGTVFGMGGLAIPSASAELVDRIVAVVNDDIVLLSELEQAMVPVKLALKAQGISPSQASAALAEKRANMLDEMIYERLTDQQVKRYGIEIDAQEVDATIERIKKVNRLSDERLRQALAMDGMTYDLYRKQVKEQLLRTKLLNYEVRSKIVITDEDVKAYYDNHKGRYQGNAKYHLRHILMKVSPEAGELERTRVYQQTQAVYQRLQQGEPFAKVASVYSDAPTAKNGGDLGVFEVNQLTDQARLALANVEVGQFSQIVETEQGYQIYYVEETISDAGTSLEEAKSEIQEKLYAEQVDQKYKSWIEQLRQRAHIEIME
jgi:peptidyl-prolyl cis-trans isomerase SurA